MVGIVLAIGQVRSAPSERPIYHGPDAGGSASIVGMAEQPCQGCTL